MPTVLRFALPLAAIVLACPLPALAQFGGGAIPHVVELSEQGRRQRELDRQADGVQRVADKRTTEARLPGEPRTTECVIKPVMSDAEIDLCRRAAR